jgi:phosphoribosylaminoimidazole-succinocarboxamide synthase
VAQSLVTDAQWQALEAGALALFSRGKQIAAANGLILVDTKYEFGVDEAGRITLADEIHTPDSSRYWLASSYAERFEAGLDPESLDKDFLRRWIAARCDPYREPIPPIPQDTLVEFAERYITLFETVTGLAFEPPDEATPVRERILGNIRRAL